MTANYGERTVREEKQRDRERERERVNILLPKHKLTPQQRSLLIE